MCPEFSGMTRPLWEARFWAKVQVGKRKECWPWMAGRERTGYGAFVILRPTKKKIGAHRFAYELVHGRLLPGFHVTHVCDNPPCCNPYHLKADTPFGNVLDMDRKGRRGCAYGERAGASKLTVEQVKEIRLAYLRGVKPLYLGWKYKVYKQTIGRIVRGERWPHVPFPCDDYLERIASIANGSLDHLAAVATGLAHTTLAHSDGAML